MSDDEIISGFVSELRRGTVVLGVLNQLSSPKYGYSLGQELTEKGVPVDGNTLYPLLRRLEKQGLLKSEWDMSEGKPRKYYVRTAKGTKINAQLRDYWIETVENITTPMKEELSGKKPAKTKRTGIKSPVATPSSRRCAPGVK